MKDESTHQPVLFEAIKLTNKPILEFGAGESSTRQLHNLTDRYILTIDDNKKWVDMYIDISCERHRFKYLPFNETEEYFRSLENGWGIVLIDSSNWISRQIAINYLKDKSDLLVIHDANYARLISIDFGKYFKYWNEYQCNELASPTTLLASNTIDLQDLEFEGTSIISSSIKR